MTIGVHHVLLSYLSKAFQRVEINRSNATVLKVHEEILYLMDAYEF